MERGCGTLKVVNAAPLTTLLGRQHDLLDVDDLTHDIADVSVLTPADEAALDARIATAKRILRRRREAKRRAPKLQPASGIRRYWTSDLRAG